MYALRLHRRALLFTSIACLLFACFAAAADDAGQNLTKDQIKTFLRTAKVIKNKHGNKGITDTVRLTLSDGTVTHDASFQGVDEHKSRELSGLSRRCNAQTTCSSVTGSCWKS